MRKVLGYSAALLLLSACTSSQESTLMDHYQQRKHYHKQLIKTEKVQLYDGEMTKIVVTATYLGSGEAGSGASQKTERFIVGIYTDEVRDTLRFLDVTLTLNGEKPLKIVALERGDPMLEKISFQTGWYRFYLVQFPKVSAKRFDLLVESKQYGKGRLPFAKQAKYTFTQKAF